MTTRSIVWFRRDLRLFDNAAFAQACEKGEVLPVFILDDVNSADWKMGAASRVWLHYALNDLDQQLGGNLLILSGDAAEILPELVETYKIDAVYWGRCYEPWRISRDKKIKQQLCEMGKTVESFNNSLLWEPWEISKSDGTPYKVFTPYYRKGCLGAQPPRQAIRQPEQPKFITPKDPTKPDDLDLLPQEINWHSQMLSHWDISRDGAENRLDEFLDEGLKQYKKGRDIPSLQATSRLAPYLHFGQISPFEIWHKARSYGEFHHLDSDTDNFCSELGWREFSHALLFYNPDLPHLPLQEKFRSFPWQMDDAHLIAWQKGQTGYPIIDAGMRELWQTGYMHNRVRMIVASFLVKNLLIPWQEGAAWFWDCLFDADLANNSASWQWVAGCGADAAPYFRIFNPVTQGEKFDPHGAYVRKYVPEISRLPDKYIHQPWKAGDLVLASNGVKLGRDYPYPIVELQSTRMRALEAYNEIKNG